MLFQELNVSPEFFKECCFVRPYDGPVHLVCVKVIHARNSMSNLAILSILKACRNGFDIALIDCNIIQVHRTVDHCEASANPHVLLLTLQILVDKVTFLTEAQIVVAAVDHVPVEAGLTCEFLIHLFKLVASYLRFIVEFLELELL